MVRTVHRQFLRKFLWKNVHTKWIWVTLVSILDKVRLLRTKDIPPKKKGDKQKDKTTCKSESYEVIKKRTLRLQMKIKDKSMNFLTFGTGCLYVLRVYLLITSWFFTTSRWYFSSIRRGSPYVSIHDVSHRLSPTKLNTQSWNITTFSL